MSDTSLASFLTAGSRSTSASSLPSDSLHSDARCGTGCDIWGKERLRLAVVLRDEVLCPTWDWFIENGTLLGAYRSGRFIPHDDDFDFGILVSDDVTMFRMEEEIRARLPAPYEVRRVSSYADKLEVYDPGSGSYVLDAPGYGGADFHHVTVDLQFHMQELDMCRCLYYRAGNGGDWVFPLDLVLPLSRLDLEGETFPAPCKVRELLTHRYGCIEEGAVLDGDTGKYRLPSARGIDEGRLDQEGPK